MKQSNQKVGICFFLAVAAAASMKVLEVVSFSTPAIVGRQLVLNQQDTTILKSHVDTFRSGYDSKNIDSQAIDSPALNRRQMMISAASLAAASATILVDTPASYAEAAAASLTKYQDEACKFSILLPSDWTQSVQQLPDRRKIVLYIKPNSEQKTLVFMAFTPVRDDYTSLGSFGSADEVAEATILPKGTLAGVQDVESEMLSVDSKKQSYIFDYITTVPPQPTTHFRTIFTLKTGATGGAGNVLVTITAQTPESDYITMKPLFDKIIDSYEA